MRSCRSPAVHRWSAIPLHTVTIMATEPMLPESSERSITDGDRRHRARRAAVCRKSAGPEWCGDLKGILQGIDWSIQHGIDIINMSLVVSGDSQVLHDAVDKAYKRGIILVGASGNAGNGKSVYYPAAYSSVIAVSATNEKIRSPHFPTPAAPSSFPLPAHRLSVHLPIAAMQSEAALHRQRRTSPACLHF